MYNSRTIRVLLVGRGLDTAGLKDGAEDVQVPEGRMQLVRGAGARRGADLAQGPPGHYARSGPEGQTPAAAYAKTGCAGQSGCVRGVSAGMAELENIIECGNRQRVGIPAAMLRGKSKVRDPVLGDKCHVQARKRVDGAIAEACGHHEGQVCHGNRPPQHQTIRGRIGSKI